MHHLLHMACLLLPKIRCPDKSTEKKKQLSIIHNRIMGVKENSFHSITTNIPGLFVQRKTLSSPVVSSRKPLPPRTGKLIYHTFRRFSLFLSLSLYQLESVFLLVRSLMCVMSCRCYVTLKKLLTFTGRVIFQVVFMLYVCVIVSLLCYVELTKISTNKQVKSRCVT